MFPSTAQKSGTNDDFEQTSKLLFTAVRVNISNKNGNLLTKNNCCLKKHKMPSWQNTILVKIPRWMMKGTKNEKQFYKRRY